MGGVVVLPLRVSRNLSTSVVEPPGTAPKGSAASLSASAASDNAKHARQPHFGDVVSQFEAKPFARHPAFGQGDKPLANLGSQAASE
jgi:hypothetical protein